MSSTRKKAADDATFHQGKFASSPEFERGLLANLVAKRCEMVDSHEDRKLIWFIQYLSRQEGGLAHTVRELARCYRDRIATRTMLQIGKAESKTYSREEIQKIRPGLPDGLGMRFPLRGETLGDRVKNCGNANDRKTAALRASAISATRLRHMAEGNLPPDEVEIEDGQAHPLFYPVSVFRELCLQAATEGLPGCAHGQKLEHELAQICLDPEWNFTAGEPWYFPQLIETLREFQAEFVQRKSDGIVVTALGKKVYDELDYTWSARILTLIEGEARTGKSTAAVAWCEQHPGQARFVEVPPGNDETSFFRAVARGLGLGNFLNSKTNEMLPRIEAVLFTGNIILVLDEAHRLWPQSQRSGNPKRIDRIMSWANQTPEHPAVPMCLISTPQFIGLQKAVEKTGWNSSQLTGRLYNYVTLPRELSLDDLRAVASASLPDADETIIRALANYALISARCLAAIDSVSKRARWIAEKSGRKTPTAQDVRTAMHESNIPSDTKLNLALATGKKSRPGPDFIEPEPSTPTTARSIDPLPAIANRRGNMEALLIA